MKTTKFLAIAALAVVLVAASCSSSDSEDSNSGSADNVTTTSQSAAVSDTTVRSATTSSTLPEIPDVAEAEISVVVPFTFGNGKGTIKVSGDSSPVVAWFANRPGEVSLDLVDADIDDAKRVVEELISFWFFQDDDSGDEPPTISESASGDITDSVGTRYVVEAQPLPPAPVAEITATTTSTTTTSTTTTTSSVPSELSVPQSTTPTTTTTTSTTTTTTPVPAVLQVQVLNGSGVAGAAGRMTDKLSEAGYTVLSPANAPQRYASSAVYYAEGWQTQAAEILAEADIDEIEEPTAMPRRFATPEAAVIVLLGTDTAPARPNPNVKLPLGDDVPRDRYVPGLHDLQIYTKQNEADPKVSRQLARLEELLRVIDEPGGIQAVEESLEWFGFTPQNVCGAPAGYSFTDLAQPVREEPILDGRLGRLIASTDRLLELYGGERINPETNLNFYIQQAVQILHDIDQSYPRTPQMVLCIAMLIPQVHIGGQISVFLRRLFCSRNLGSPSCSPGSGLEGRPSPTDIQILEITYHVKAISRNGNLAYIISCKKTFQKFAAGRWEGTPSHLIPEGEGTYRSYNSSHILYWRNAGYRADYSSQSTRVVAAGPKWDSRSGCQEEFEASDNINGLVLSKRRDEHDNLYNVYFGDDAIVFNFGERSFSDKDLPDFPRG